MSIYKPRGSSFYHYDFTIERYRFAGSTKCHDERDAQAVEEGQKKDARELVDRLKAEGSQPLRLGAAASRWWNERGSTLADTTLKSALDRLVELMGADTFLHAIKDNDVSIFVQQRRKDVRRDRTLVGKDGRKKILYRPITATTVNRSVDLLRRIMNHARDNWNAAIMRPPKWRKHKLKEKRRHVREISKDEETRLDQAEAFDYAELRRFMTVTGLRRREALITWSQVDFELGVISVFAKGDQPRVIPMTAEIYAMLWRRRGQHATAVFTYKAHRTWKDRTRNGVELGDIIRGQRYPITMAGFGSNKQRRWKAAGVDARIHDLRHTAGMRTLRRTGNLKVVQTLLGHSSIKTTSEFYTTALVEDLRAAMEATSLAEIQAPRLLPFRKDLK